MESHEQRLSDVLRQVRTNDQRLPVKINHGSSNSTRLPDFTGRHVVDTSGLRHIIEVNAADRYALVEPSVQLDELVKATLEHGLVPPVVPEFPGISVGGAVQGGAAESGSFKFGGFHETALEYEIVLGDGSVVKASRDKRADLFWGTACSYGSLGIMTLIKLRLIPAKPFVKLTYRRSGSDDEALRLIAKAMGDKNLDFMDGILLGPEHGVIMTGVFADKDSNKELPVTRFSQPDDEWFFLHAQEVSRTQPEYSELIPLEDYLFRYDRGAFWVGKLGFAITKMPFNRWTRKKLDRRMHTRWLYKWVHRTNLSQRFFVQDIFMPEQNVKPFLEYVEPKLGIWPLWLLPMRASHENLDSFGLSVKGAKYMVNVGVWGDIGAKSFEAFKQVNREVEGKLIEFQAHKTLYAHSYYPKDTFWKIYDKSHYDKLRRKYHAEGIFDNIYDKVTVTQEYKMPVGRAMARRLGEKLATKLKRLTG